CSSAFLSLALGSTDVAGKTFDAGGSIGSAFGSVMAEYLNRTGSIIVLLTLMMLSVILSTQFSLGRMFAGASATSRDISARGRGWFNAWRDERRKEKARTEAVAKKTAKSPAVKAAKNADADGVAANRPRPIVPDDDDEPVTASASRPAP